jgi:integrase
MEDHSMKTARLLKSQLTYQIPEVKLFLVREPQAKKTAAFIHTPDDIEALLEPLRHYPDYVPLLIVCQIHWSYGIAGGASPCWDT